MHIGKRFRMNHYRKEDKVRVEKYNEKDMGEIEVGFSKSNYFTFGKGLIGDRIQ